ncbi:hypothetical protein DFH28DRAFT_26877 [Melampsora americana]|nr:hypothetical protein DFH28DRAFT_26877 [Melampsora americana]
MARRIPYTLHKWQGNEREVFTGDFKDDYVSYASGLERRAMEPDESATSVCSRPLVIHLDDTVSAPPPNPTVSCREKIRRMCPDDYDKDGLDYESGKRRQAIREAQEAFQPQSTGKELLIINLGPDEALPVAGPSSPSESSIKPKLDSIVKVLRSHSLNSISDKLKTALNKTKGKARSRVNSSIADTNPELTLKRRGICLDSEDIQEALKEQFGLEIEPASDSGYVYATPDEPSHELDDTAYVNALQDLYIETKLT